MRSNDCQVAVTWLTENIRVVGKFFRKAILLMTENTIR